MKLTLQLVVVVLNTQKKFRDNLLKFTLHTMGSSRYFPYPPPPIEGTFALDPSPPGISIPWSTCQTPRPRSGLQLLPFS